MRRGGREVLLQLTRAVGALLSGRRLQLGSSRLNARHFELKAVLHGRGLHRLGLQAAQRRSRRLHVRGGGAECHTVLLHQRGLSLQLSDLSPEVFDGLLQLLDDVDMLFLQFGRGEDTFLLRGWQKRVRKHLLKLTLQVMPFS